MQEELWGIGIRWGDDFDKGKKKFKYLFVKRVGPGFLRF